MTPFAGLRPEPGVAVFPRGDRRYRTWLTRNWIPGPPSKLNRLVWLMLNPSVADADHDDATLRRIIAFSKREGYDGLEVVNVSAYVSTDPKGLRDPLAQAMNRHNRHTVMWRAEGRDVVVAWGAIDPEWQGWAWHLGGEVQRVARSVRCLGYTKSGDPKHPLRLRADTPFVVWPAPL